MRVRDVMTTPAITVRVGTPIKVALRLLDERAITALPVVAGNDRVVGVVSEADLIRDALMPDARHHLRPAPEDVRTLPPETVGEVMSARPITVTADDDLLDAVELLTSTGIKSLPVVDEHMRVVGVVSRRDVVHVIARPDETLAAELGDLFQRIGLDWLVDVHRGVATVTGPVTKQESAMAVAAAGSIPGIAGAVIGQAARTSSRKGGM